LENSLVTLLITHSEVADDIEEQGWGLGSEDFLEVVEVDAEWFFRSVGKRFSLIEKFLELREEFHVLVCEESVKKCVR
jgi:hypothetical protein